MRQRIPHNSCSPDIFGRIPVCISGIQAFGSIRYAYSVFWPPLPFGDYSFFANTRGFASG